ncbi:MAG: AAA family ATPase [Myxococcales bacterium]|nr:AAA family ATPase [Myxococcales bacterium]
MAAPTGFTIAETLHHGSRSTVHRATRHVDGRTVILKVARQQPPSPEVLAEFQREHRISAGLVGPHVSRVTSLITTEELVALVIEDFAGIPLSTLVLPLDLPRFFAIADGVAAALADLHSQRIVHGDIKPHNILIDPSTGLIKLADFALSMTFEEAGLRPPSLSGTLAYLAPEQSGRLARPVDHRADLYSLGITLYELLAGRTPFADHDAAEIVHAHLAQRPPPLAPLGVPPILAAIVDKLLAKDPDERYQGVHALRQDLARAAADPDARFTLGADDRASQLRPLRRLYGRSAELAALEVAVELSDPTPQLWMIAGDEGLGRTSLLEAFVARVPPGAATLIRGAFDPYQRDLPFASLLRTLDGLRARLDALPEGARQRRIDRIRAHVGPALPTVLDVLPGLRAHLDEPAEQAPAEGIREAQNRLRIALSRLLQAFADEEAPLVLVVDDLQAADRATLALLQGLLCDPETRHTVVVGALRRRPGAPATILDGVLGALKIAGVDLRVLELGPLDTIAIRHLLADALGSPQDELAELAELIERRTEGKPLQIQELLQQLVRVGALAFDHRLGRWRWSPEAIRVAAIEAMSAQLADLPPALRERLMIAACIGRVFEIGAVARIAGDEIETSAPILAQAIRGGILVEHDRGGRCLRFAHERVRRAIYLAIPDERIPALRLAVGRDLLAGAGAADSDATLLAAIEHIDAGLSALDADADGLRELAELNLRAGRRAKLAGAHEAALRYLDTGLRLLGDAPAGAAAELAFAVLLEIAECEHLAGRRGRADATFARLRVEARDPLARARVANAQVSLLVSQGDNAAAIDVGLASLAELGLPILGEALPRAADDQALLRAIGPVLAGLVVATSLDRPELFERIAALILPLVDDEVASLDAAFAAHVYAFHCVADPARRSEGLAWAQRGQALVDRIDPEAITSRVAFGQALLAHHRGHLADALERLEHCRRSALVEGDFVYASFACSHLLIDKLLLGAPLDELSAEADHYLALMRLTQVASATATQQVSRQMIAALRGLTDDLTSLGAELDGPVVAASLRGAPFARAWYAVCKLLLALLHRREAELSRLLALAEASSARTSGFFLADLLIAYGALGHALLAERDPTARARAVVELDRAAAHFALRASQTPATYRHLHHLVEAERSRVAGDPLGAIEHYDRAISAAEEGGFLPHLALAHELVGRLHLAAGRRASARLHLAAACEAYRGWGALPKAELLARLLGDAAPPPSESSSRRAGPRSAGGGGGGSDRVDLRSILKAAHAFASVVDLDGLISTILVIVVENAGAERGVLLLEEEEAIRVMADYSPDGRTPLAAAGQTLSEASGIPRDLLRTAMVSAEVMVFADAAGDPEALADPDVVARRPRSILCLPVTHQGVPLGALYLENNLVTGAFTRERLALLQILTTEVAIALENARHYEDARRAQIAAEAANRAKSTFLANMSHELRTPLNAIIGYSELLTEDALDAGAPHLVDDLGRIGQAAHHLLSIIADILDISKIEAGRMSVSLEPVDLDALVDELAAIIGPEIARGGNKLVIVRDPGIHRIASDATKIRQILLNLLGNAARFTAKGEIRLSLRLVDDPAAGARRLELAVADTGIGIRPELLQTIFEPFRQADDSPTRIYGGAGLGLAISRRLAHLLGGDIDVESEVGRGSTFVVTLPID